MTFNVLWPAVRWPDDRQIEKSSVEGDGVAFFSESFDTVTDEQWQSCDAIVSFKDIPEEHRLKLSRCKIFVTSKVGFDNIDTAYWGSRGIPVCNVPDYGTRDVADHAIALMLALMKGIVFHTRELKADPEKNWRPMLNPFGRRLSACTFGVAGLGRIGTATALRSKAFGMRVICFDPFLENGCELALGIERVHSLGDLFAASDVVSLHVPLTGETRGMVNAEIMAASKQGLMLVNTARGEVVDLDALYNALKANHVQAAGLDVLSTEPADPTHPLIKAWHDNEPWIDHRLIVTPHSAFCTPESMHDMRYKAGRVAIEYLTDGRLQNCVNGNYLKTR